MDTVLKPARLDLDPNSPPLLTFSQSVVQELQISIVLLLTTYHITCMNILKTVLIIIQRSKY